MPKTCNLFLEKGNLTCPAESMPQDLALSIQSSDISALDSFEAFVHHLTG